MDTQNNLKKRDKWETKIAIAEEQERIKEKMMGHAKDVSKQYKKEYKQWLKDTGVSPMRYPDL